MKQVDFPQARGSIALEWVDITPPWGIYHRMWGASTHERATGVHRPLRATVLVLQPREPERTRCLIGLDHCLLESDECRRIADAVARATSIPPSQVLVACSHTHAAGLMTRSRADLPGGEHIAPYLDEIALRTADAARIAQRNAAPATVQFAAGRCSLAKNRDFFDSEYGGFVCGYAPDGPSDDTVLVARITAESGKTLGTIVNYACHPTTLAWENTLISPDYIGACRETIETATGAPCLFLQGASGDLGPRVGFVGDTEIADSHGRQLGHAVLSALESLPPAATRFTYAGPVVSGATVGTWRYESLHADESQELFDWQSNEWQVDLEYRADLLSIEEYERQWNDWRTREVEANARLDKIKARDCHAQVERCKRQLHRLRQLPSGQTFPFQVELWRWGGTLWLFLGGEHYQNLQVELRRRHPRTPLVVATLTNSWLPGYVPPASVYGSGIYQETVALVAPGSAEALLESIGRQIDRYAVD